MVRSRSILASRSPLLQQARHIWLWSLQNLNSSSSSKMVSCVAIQCYICVRKLQLYLYWQSLWGWVDSFVFKCWFDYGNTNTLVAPSESSSLKRSGTWEINFLTRITGDGTAIRVDKVHVEPIDTNGGAACNRHSENCPFFDPTRLGRAALPQNQHMETADLLEPRNLYTLVLPK